MIAIESVGKGPFHMFILGAGYLWSHSLGQKNLCHNEHAIFLG